MQFTPRSNSMKLPKISPDLCRGVSLRTEPEPHSTSSSQKSGQESISVWLLTVLSAAPERREVTRGLQVHRGCCFMCWVGVWSHLTVNRLLLTCCSHCVRRRLLRLLCVLYRTPPWNLIFKGANCRKCLKDLKHLKQRNPQTHHDECLFMINISAFSPNLVSMCSLCDAGRRKSKWCSSVSPELRPWKQSSSLLWGSLESDLCSCFFSFLPRWQFCT